MSKFFVGQRVRLARPVEPANIGWTGVITGTDFVPKGTPLLDGPLCQDCDCEVRWDTDGNAHLQHTNQLEPITPDGAQPSEFTTLHDLLTSLEGVAA